MLAPPHTPLVATPRVLPQPRALSTRATLSPRAADIVDAAAALLRSALSARFASAAAASCSASFAACTLLQRMLRTRANRLFLPTHSLTPSSRMPTLLLTHTFLFLQRLHHHPITRSHYQWRSTQSSRNTTSSSPGRRQQASSRWCSSQRDRSFDAARLAPPPAPRCVRGTRC